MLPWHRHIHQLHYEKVEVCVVNLLTANFGDQRIEGFRGKVNETEVLKTVLLLYYDVRFLKIMLSFYSCTCFPLVTRINCVSVRFDEWLL